MAIPNQIFISSSTNTVNVNSDSNSITVSSSFCNTLIDVSQPVTSIVTITTPGPPGPQGPIGPQGPMGTFETGSLATTGSNIFIGDQTITGSVTATLGFTGSLFGTASFATTSSFPWNITGSNISYINGNVGIGTTNPIANLDIYSSASNSSFRLVGNAGVFTSLYRYSNNATRPRYEMYKARGTDSVPLIIQSNDELGSIDFHGYDGTAFQRNAIVLVQALNVSSSIITPRYLIGLGPNAGGNNYFFSLTSTGTVLADNASAISPSAKLHVRGSGSASTTTALRVENSAASPSLVVTDDGQTTFGNSSAWRIIIDPTSGTNPGGYISYRGSDNFVYFQQYMQSAFVNYLTTAASSYGFRWYAQGTEALRISSVANVGIGLTSNPTTKLQVRGSGATSSTTALLIQNSTPSDILLVRDDGRIAFGSSGAGNAPLLYNSGNEGGSIDVSSRKLAFVSQDGNPGSNFSFILNNPAGITTGTLNNIVSRASITLSSGDTILNQYLINPTLALSGTYSGTVRGIFYNPVVSITAGTHRAIETAAGDVLFRSGSATLLLVSGSGNVGIGTSTPTSRLDINNTLSSTVGLTITSPQTSAASLVLSTIGTPGINNGALLILRHADGTFPTPGVTAAARIISSQLSQYFNGSSYVTATNIIDISDGKKIFGATPSIVGTLTYYGKLDNGNWYFGDLSTNINTARDRAVSSRVQIQGSGTTSATTALRVENSNASASLVVLDNGRVGINTGSAQFNLDVTGTTNLQASNTRIRVENDGSGGITMRAGLFQSINMIGTEGNVGGGSGTLLLTGNSTTTDSGFKDVFAINQTISTPASNFNTLTLAAWRPSISQSRGIIRGIYYNPTITHFSGGTHMFMESTAGNVLFQSGSTPLFFVSQSGNVGIGTTTPAFTLDVSGSGRFTSNVTVTGSVIIDGGLFDTITTSSLPSGSHLLYSFSTASYQAGFFDYYVISGSNFRAGTIMSVAGAGTYRFTDQATPDIGDTTNLQFSMSLDTSNLQLYASASSNSWTIKTTFRTI